MKHELILKKYVNKSAMLKVFGNAFICYLVRPESETHFKFSI